MGASASALISGHTRAHEALEQRLAAFMRLPRALPLNDRDDAADLVVRLALPVILVVGKRFGCLNHALPTVEAIAARGLELAGWIANRINPHMAKADENIAALRERIGAPLLDEVPFLARANARDAAKRLDLSTL